jgi:hypothetical protein
VNLTFPQECLDFDARKRTECSGPVRYRMTLSVRGRCFTLCDFHWTHRLQQLDETNEVYPPPCPPGVWSLVAPTQVVERIMEDVVNWPTAE